jgi:hypothetical protein
MNLSLEAIKGLMRRSVALPDNMSETEIRHYAGEVLKRLRHGENVETLELYLRRIKTSNSPRFQISPDARQLAERAFVLVNDPS